MSSEIVKQSQRIGKWALGYFIYAYVITLVSAYDFNRNANAIGLSPNTPAQVQKTFWF